MIGSIDTSLQLQTITTVHNQWLSMTRSIPYWTTGVFSSTVTNDERILLAHTLNFLKRRLSDEWILDESESYIMTDVQSASLSWNKAPILFLRSDYITVRQLRVFWCGALSLTRGRFCCLQLLLALAIVAILGSESHDIRDHISLS
jgi:hypothetical protein